MSTQGGRWSKKAKIVNVVCERPLMESLSIPSSCLLQLHVGCRTILYYVYFVIAKGQVISKRNFEVIVLPRIRMKYLTDFCPSL